MQSVQCTPAGADDNTAPQQREGNRIKMAERFAIREISRLFHIPESTLRYWEDRKILSPGKAENGYRMYSVEDLMTISDIVFYKNLGLSLSEIGGMEKVSPEEHRKLFGGRMAEIEQQRTLLERQMAKLKRHMQALDTLEELQKHPFQEADPGAVCMVSFELVEKEKLLQYNRRSVSLLQGAALQKSERGTPGACRYEGEPWRLSRGCSLRTLRSLAGPWREICDLPYEREDHRGLSQQPSFPPSGGAENPPDR